MREPEPTFVSVDDFMVRTSLAARTVTIVHNRITNTAIWAKMLDRMRTTALTYDI